MRAVVGVTRAHLRGMDSTNEPQIATGSTPASASVDDWGLERMMDVTELAAYLGVPVSTVYNWRTHGKGPWRTDSAST